MNDEKTYYQCQEALLDTQMQVSLFVNLYYKLMVCVVNRDRYCFRLLAKMTDRTLYPYQLTGAIGMTSRLFRKIDPDIILE